MKAHVRAVYPTSPQNYNLDHQYFTDLCTAALLQQLFIQLHRLTHFHVILNVHLLHSANGCHVYKQKLKSLRGMHMKYYIIISLIFHDSLRQTQLGMFCNFYYSIRTGKSCNHAVVHVKADLLLFVSTPKTSPCCKTNFIFTLK